MPKYATPTFITEASYLITYVNDCKSDLTAYASCLQIFLDLNTYVLNIKLKLSSILESTTYC